MFPSFATRGERWAYAASLSITLLRLALGGALLLVATQAGSGLKAAIILCVGFVSDVYDGVIARRFGVATPGLRRLDSATDTVFYLAAAVCVWRLHPTAILDHRWLLIAVVGTLALNHTVELMKFGRESSYHAWSAKAWGVSLFLALVLLFAGNTDRMIPVALSLGLVSHLENLAITVVLPVWRHDVATVAHAWAMRQSARDAKGSSS